MTNGDIDLRGTQGAVVLPGGTVVQHYPGRETEQSSMNPQTPGDINNRVYDQGRELSEIRARLTTMEANAIRMEADIKQIMALLQRPSVAVTFNQLLVSIGLALVVVLSILAATYAGQ